MLTSPRLPRTLGKWIAIGSALLACTPTPKSVKVSDTGKAGAISIDTADIYGEDWSTPLPEGVSSSPDTFRARLGVMKFTSGGRHRRQRAGKYCNCSVDVDIGAISPTRPIDPDRPPVPAPRAVALIQNLDGGHVEAYYGLKPKSRADYYFWIDAPSGRSRITVLEVPTADGRVRGGKQKYLQVCHHYAHVDTADFGDADFVEYRSPPRCETMASGMSKASVASPFSPAGFGRVFVRVLKAFYPSSLTSEGGWIDCNSGCCW